MGPVKYIRVQCFGVTEDATVCAILFVMFLTVSLLNGQSEHNCAEQKQPSSLHADVPFPQPFGFCRVLLISHNYHAEGLSQERSNYPCAWLCGPLLSCSDIWVSWVLPGGCHGLWPLCGHFLTSALLHTDVLYSLNPSNGSLLPRWMQILRYLLVIASICPLVDQIKLIIYSMTIHHFQNFLVLMTLLLKSFKQSLQAASLWSLYLSLFCLMSTSFSPFWKYIQLRATRFPSPPAPPILLQSLCSMRSSYSFVWCPSPATPWTRTRWCLCSTRWPLC